MSTSSETPCMLKLVTICLDDEAAYRVYVYILYPLRRTIRPTFLQGIQHIHIHTICCLITETYNRVFNLLTNNFSKENFMLPEDDLKIETCRSDLTFWSRNFTFKF